MFGLQKALGSYFEGQERKKKEKIKRKEKEGTHTHRDKQTSEKWCGSEGGCYALYAPNSYVETESLR